MTKYFTIINKATPRPIGVTEREFKRLKRRKELKTYDKESVISIHSEEMKKYYNLNREIDRDTFINYVVNSLKKEAFNDNFYNLLAEYQVSEQDKKEIEEKIKNKAFTHIKDRRKFLNISSIEEHCGITRTSLLNAINRDQNGFGQSDKLIEFLNSFFEGWDSD